MTRPIGCRDAIERLWDYLDGALEAEGHDELEAHLTWCLQCCGELEFARHLRGLLRERATPRMPIDVAVRLHRAVDELEPPEGFEAHGGHRSGDPVWPIDPDDLHRPPRPRGLTEE